MSDTSQQPVVLRVLLVEDTAERQEWLQGLYREHAWVLVHTAARAIRLLHAYDFDLISLDFNLAGPDNGDTVARAIAGSRNARTPVLVHSMNPRGAEHLAELLPHAVCVPLSAIMKSNRTVKRVREALRHGVPADWRQLLTTDHSDPE
jgi:CheY-like chemotaxis protein